MNPHDLTRDTINQFAHYCELQNASTALSDLLVRLEEDDLLALLSTGELIKLLKINQRLVKSSEKSAADLLAHQIQSVEHTDTVDYWQLFESLDLADRQTVNILIGRLIKE